MKARGGGPRQNAPRARRAREPRPSRRASSRGPARRASRCSTSASPSPGPFGTQLLVGPRRATSSRSTRSTTSYWHANHIAYWLQPRQAQHRARPQEPERPCGLLDRLVAARRRRAAQHALRRAAIRLGIDYESLRSDQPATSSTATPAASSAARARSCPATTRPAPASRASQYEDGGCGRGGKPIWSLTRSATPATASSSAIAICQALYAPRPNRRGPVLRHLDHQRAAAQHELLPSPGPTARGFERPLLDAMQTGFSARVRIYTDAGRMAVPLALVTRDAPLAARSPGRLELPELAPGGAIATARRARAKRRRRSDAPRAPLRDGQTAKSAFARSTPPVSRAKYRGEERRHRALEPPEVALEDQFVAKYPHRVIGEIGQPGLAFQFSDTPTRVQSAPMMVGEHTREILRDPRLLAARPTPCANLRLVWSPAAPPSSVIREVAANPTLPRASKTPVASRVLGTFLRKSPSAPYASGRLTQERPQTRLSQFRWRARDERR